MSRRRSGGRGSAGGLRRYHQQTSRALTGFLMGFPLALSYALAIALGGQSAAEGDFFVELQLSVLGERGYLWLQSGLAATFLVLLLVLARRGKITPAYFAPLIVEAMIYAAALSSAVWFGSRALGLRSLSGGKSFSLISALGEAINQETFFRWVLLEALLWLGHRVGTLRASLARVLAVVVGAGLYAGVGTFAMEIESNDLFVLLGRGFSLGLAGLLWGALYFARGYPVCAYTHLLFAVFWGGVLPRVASFGDGPRAR